MADPNDPHASEHMGALSAEQVAERERAAREREAQAQTAPGKQNRSDAAPNSKSSTEVPGQAETENPATKKQVSQQYVEAEAGFFRQLMRRIGDFFRRITGNEPLGPATTTRPMNAADRKDVLNAVDDLTDESNSLKQRFENTMQDLVKSTPTQPESDDPAQWDAYAKDLTSHQKTIDKEREAYNSKAADLQDSRDTLLTKAEDLGIDIPEADALDTTLGADGAGPGNRQLVVLSQNNSEALALAHQTLSDIVESPEPLDLDGAEPEMATPVPDMKADNIPRGKDSRLAIGRRMVEIMQSGPQVNQQALDREFDRLMPKKEPGMAGMKDRHEQHANMAFATAMAKGLSEMTQKREGAEPTTPEALLEEREHFMDNSVIQMAANDINQRQQYDTVEKSIIQQHDDSNAMALQYAALASVAGMASQTFSASSPEAEVGNPDVDMVRTPGDREAVVEQVQNVMQEAAARAQEEDRADITLTEQEQETIRDAIGTLSKGQDITQQTPTDAIHQMRNEDLASFIASDVNKSLETGILTGMNSGRSEDTISPVLMAGPSLAELQEAKDDPDGFYKDAESFASQSQKNIADAMDRIAPKEPAQPPQQIMSM